MSAHGREARLAAALHTIWAQGMRALFDVCAFAPDGSCTLPSPHVRVWWDLMTLPYSALSEPEQARVRAHVRTVLDALREAGEA